MVPVVPAGAGDVFADAGAAALAVAVAAVSADDGCVGCGVGVVAETADPVVTTDAADGRAGGT